jgi:hypothetical protein
LENTPPSGQILESEIFFKINLQNIWKTKSGMIFKGVSGASRFFNFTDKPNIAASLWLFAYGF